MKRMIAGTLICAGIALIAAPRARAAERMQVFVSIPPQAGLVERVGGERVAVHVLVKPGQDPHTFDPTPQQVMALGRARLYFRLGMPFEERLLEKIQGAGLPLTVVDTAAGIEKRAMGAHHHEDAEEHGHHEHDEHAHHEGGHESHGHGHHEEEHHEGKGEHDEDGEHKDPHVWLSPPLIKVMAANVADALIAADPDGAEDYRANLTAFLKDVDATHARIAEVLAPYRGRSFYVFHPAFGYFGDAYGLVQEAVEVEGKSPTPRELSALIKKAKAEDVRIIFVQPQFDTKSAEAVAKAIDGAVVPMDPLARDVLANLEAMAAQMEKALGKPAPADAAEQTAE